MADYFVSNDDLTTIINQTSNAIDEMNTLNSMVQSHTGVLAEGNISDSGTRMQQHLDTWNADFHTCVNSLTELNTKVHNLQIVNKNTNLNASGLSH
jgi:hypothetical protein